MLKASRGVVRKLNKIGLKINNLTVKQYFVILKF